MGQYSEDLKIDVGDIQEPFSLAGTSLGASARAGVLRQMVGGNGYSPKADRQARKRTELRQSRW